MAERARELGFDEVIQGQGEKLPAFLALCARRGIAPDEVAYVGDDLPDLPILSRVGLPAAPADAVAEVRAVATVQLPRPGGRGAVRCFVEAILKAQDRWAELLRRYTAKEEGRS